MNSFFLWQVVYLNCASNKFKVYAGTLSILFCQQNTSDHHPEFSKINNEIPDIQLAKVSQERKISMVTRLSKPSNLCPLLKANMHLSEETRCFKLFNLVPGWSCNYKYCKLKVVAFLAYTLEISSYIRKKIILLARVQ